MLLISGRFIAGLVSTYGYAGVFGLMLLEGSSLPVPSEIVLPVAGYFASKGLLDLWLVVLAGFAGNMLGVVIDYAIGYYVGREQLYKHLHLFHIKRRTLDEFDGWFKRNGTFAIFVSRMIPVLRTVMSFPAGFAKMEFRHFILYSAVGTFIWDFVLVLFGFYLLSGNDAVVVMSAIAVLILILYLIHRRTIGYFRKRSEK